MGNGDLENDLKRPDYITTEISLNAEKNPGKIRGLVFTLSQMKITQIVLLLKKIAKIKEKIKRSHVV